MMAGKNVLLIWDRMGDYHRARWYALRKELQHVTVLAADLGSSDDLYGWKNTSGNSNYFQLSPKRPEQWDLRRFYRFVSILKRYNVGTICIAGYGRIEYLFFLLYGRLSGRKVIIFAESWYPGNYFVDNLKSVFLRAICDGFLVSGTRAFTHFEKRLKIHPSRMRRGYSVVDNDHFKRQEQFSNGRRILCVARFSPEKNLHSLIQAFLGSKLYDKNWELLVVGGGPLKASLEKLCSDHKQVNLSEWKSYGELPSLYSSASIFVLPSVFEPWGLVVNEAMAAGLPVLLSDEVGCLPDMLVDGKNGWHFKPEANQIMKVFNLVADCPQNTLLTMGNNSREIVANFTLQTFSRNLHDLMN